MTEFEEALNHAVRYFRRRNPLFTVTSVQVSPFDKADIEAETIDGVKVVGAYHIEPGRSQLTWEVKTWPIN